ncbi:MAG: LacI family transcriptional regulator [Puniceicoccaceae bacterium]|nr:MAG: LacI family transcriptional regulator [Puniceicoccaceae bacterium]
MDAGKRVTLRDIAAQLGVSAMTVSAALRNTKGVSAGMRKRVREVADRLGYRPDPMVSALTAYRLRVRPKLRHNTLAFVTDWPTREDWKSLSADFPRYYAGARERAEELGYAINHFWVRGEARDAAHASKVLAARGVEGVLVSPMPEPEADLGLDWKRFAGVALGVTMEKSGLPYVSHNQFSGMRLLCRELRKLGYRRIGFAIQSWVVARTGHRWLAAYLAEEVAQAGDNDRVPPFLEGWETAGMGPLLAWLERERPEVVISVTPALIEDLERAGWRVPEDLGFASPCTDSLESRVAGIFQHPEEIGAAAAEFLHALLMQGRRGKPHPRPMMLLDGSWHPGATVRRVR